MRRRRPGLGCGWEGSNRAPDLDPVRSLPPRGWPSSRGAPAGGPGSATTSNYIGSRRRTVTDAHLGDATCAAWVRARTRVGAHPPLDRSANFPQRGSCGQPDPQRLRSAA